MGSFRCRTDGGNDLAPRFQQAAVGLGHVGFYQFVKPGEVVIGHQREHVVFHMVVHLPIQVAVDGVHVDRPAVEPMVEHVFGKARMLGVAVDELQPTAVKGRQADEHQRQDAARVDRKADDAA